jgi:hypothetical protein
MIIHRKLAAGKPGTKKLLQKYGNQLLCVRYRYDSEKKEKMKTVEIIVQKKPWDGKGRKMPGNKIIPIRVAYEEIKIRRIVKAAGGKWNMKGKVWELPYKEVRALGLEDRIVVR